MERRAPLPPLAAVRAFEAAARQGSFTRAGAELGMSQAAVSYQIKLLEERVGTSLFRRSGRQKVLTAAGEQLAAGISEAFERMRLAFAKLRGEVDGVLTVSAVGAFATNWLAPRIGAFQLRHPNLAVRVSMTSRLVDFSQEDVDVALRAGRGPWPGLLAHRLLPMRFTPICSPDLLRRFAPVINPADLLRLPLLTPSDPWWGRWFELAGVEAPELTTRPGIDLESQQIEGQAALAGQGVAMLTPAMWGPELSSGRLVQVFDLVGGQGESFWLVYPEARRNVPKIRAWRDWLIEEMSRCGGTNE
ncbi:MAG: LysR substrate-binding domain-containing protein [Geminicoccaceae bacterium]